MRKIERTKKVSAKLASACEDVRWDQHLLTIEPAVGGRERRQVGCRWEPSKHNQKPPRHNRADMWREMDLSSWHGRQVCRKRGEARDV